MYVGEKRLSQKHIEALRHIRNSLVHRGYTPSVRELMMALKYKSPRSAAVILEDLVEMGFLKRRSGGRPHLLSDPEEPNNAKTVGVPLVGAVACGMPLLAEENIEGMISVSQRLVRPGSRYFLLRAKGDSMDKAGIHDGDLVLVRQQQTANDGDVVVALIDDEATVKELHRGSHAVVLKPRSTNRKHQPIILTKDFRVQGVVTATISNPH